MGDYDRGRSPPPRDRSPPPRERSPPPSSGGGGFSGGGGGGGGGGHGERGASRLLISVLAQSGGQQWSSSDRFMATVSYGTAARDICPFPVLSPGREGYRLYVGNVAFQANPPHDIMPSPQLSRL